MLTSYIRKINQTLAILIPALDNYRRSIESADQLNDHLNVLQQIIIYFSQPSLTNKKQIPSILTV